MTQGSRAAKKPYSPPPLEVVDASAGGTEKTQGPSEDRPTEERKYWLAVAIHLAPIMLVCSIPFVVLLLITTTSIEHYLSLDILAGFGACWAIFALWITLRKGMGSALQDTPGTIWLLLGVLNLIGAVVLLTYAR
jgi:hypothetical protein